MFAFYHSICFASYGVYVLLSILQVISSILLLPPITIFWFPDSLPTLVPWYLPM